MKKVNAAKSNRKQNDGKRRRSNRGIRLFLREVHRVSYTRGIACFCTPGHNRGAGL